MITVANDRDQPRAGLEVRARVQPIAPLALLGAGILLVAAALKAAVAGWGILIFAGVVLGFCALAVVAVLVVRRWRITVSGDVLLFANGLRTRSLTGAGPIVRIVETDVDYGRLLSGGWRIWLLVDARGRGVLRLDSRLWERQELERLRQALDVPLERRTKRVSVRGLRREVPGAYPFWQAHLVATTLVALILVAAAVYFVGRL